MVILLMGSVSMKERGEKGRMRERKRRERRKLKEEMNEREGIPSMIL